MKLHGIHGKPLCDFKESVSFYKILISQQQLLVVNTSDSGSRGRGFEPHSGHRVVSLSKTYLPPKVLVIPRKQWLRPSMTDKLFTGTLSIKQTKTKPKFDDCLWLDPPWFNSWFSLALARSVGILTMRPLHCFIIVF